MQEALMPSDIKKAPYEGGKRALNQKERLGQGAVVLEWRAAVGYAASPGYVDTRLRSNVRTCLFPNASVAPRTPALDPGCMIMEQRGKVKGGNYER